MMSEMATLIMVDAMIVAIMPSVTVIVAGHLRMEGCGAASYRRADDDTFIGSGGRARRMDRKKRGAAPYGAKAKGPDGPARRLREH